MCGSSFRPDIWCLEKARSISVGIFGLTAPVSPLSLNGATMKLLTSLINTPGARSLTKPGPSENGRVAHRIAKMIGITGEVVKKTLTRRYFTSAHSPALNNEQIVKIQVKD